MWFKKVGVTGIGEFTAEEIEAGFSLIGLDFDILVTVDDDRTISKQARRFCYNNKYHDRIKKIQDNPLTDPLIDELAGEASILLHFGNDLNSMVDSALFGGILVVLFPENFTESMKEGWKQNV